MGDQRPRTYWLLWLIPVVMIGVSFLSLAIPMETIMRALGFPDAVFAGEHFNFYLDDRKPSVHDFPWTAKLATVIGMVWFIGGAASVPIVLVITLMKATDDGAAKAEGSE